MTLPEILETSWTVATIAFDFLAVFLLYRLIKTRKTLTEREKIQKQKVYQISILKEIQDRIGYSLDLEEVIDVITGSLEHLFPYSSAGSLIAKDNKLIFKIHLEEAVSRNYIDEVKKSMNASLLALVPNLPTQTVEELSGVALDEVSNRMPKSFFHIPLIISNEVLAIINVSSTKPNLYKEEEMTILYQIASEASNALTRLKEVLETEKGKLTSMIRDLADGVFMVDTKKELLIINEAAKRFLDTGKENPNFFDILGAFKEQYDILSKIDESMNQNKTIEEKEVTLDEKTCHIYITPVLSQENEGKKVVGASILIHDITLEKKLAAIKEDFTNMMVHDIRAPLTGIRASSELLMDGKLTPEEESQMLKIIKHQSRVLLDEIGSILDAAKIEAKSFTIKKSLGDIGRTIEETVASLQPLAIKKQITLSLTVDSQLPKIDFDAVRISQVISNLISNSLKFTQAGGKILVSAKTKPGFLDVTVADDGAGIPKDELPDLFSKFYQIRKTPSELAKKGTGLGLYIVKGIVQAHDGTVSVESEEGHGTKITFSLPIGQDHEEKLSELNEPVDLGHLPPENTASAPSPSVTTSTSPH